jgi:hypothetical protein
MRPQRSPRLACLGVFGLFGPLLGACEPSARVARDVHLPPPEAASPGPSARPSPTGGKAASKPASPSDALVDPAPGSRTSPVPSACRRRALELPPDLEPCACDQQQTFVSATGATSVRAGDWCGPPLDEEKGPPDTTAHLEKVVLASGEAARVRVELHNPTQEVRVYRASRRYSWARFVKPSGQLLSMTGLGSSSYNDEALVELWPLGTATFWLEVPGKVPRYRGKKVVLEPLPPGSYAVEVELGTLGGKRLLQVEVR